MSATRLRPHGRAVAERIAALPGWLLPAGALALFTLLLLPIIHAPYFSDDITSSEVIGYRELTGTTLLGLYWDGVWGFITDSGRPQVLSGIPGYPVFNLLGDGPVAYHFYILAMTVLDAALLYALLRRLRAPAGVAALVVVIAGAWIQFRIYHDSMVSFAGLVQTVLALVLGSLVLFARWLDEGRRRDVVAAALLFAAACAIYEVAYPLFAAHVALALSERRGRAALRAAAPFIGVAALFVLASAVMRRVASAAEVSYTVGGGGGPWTMLRTYAVQLFSPLPAMSIVADPSISGSPTTGELFASVWRGLAAAAAVALLAVALLRARAMRWAPLVAVALGLYFAPPLLLAIAPKYQRELSVANGYLPVLIQVFALAVLAVGLLAALVRLAERRSRAMVALTVAVAAAFAGVTAGVTAFNNIRVLGMLQPDLEARSLVEAAAEREAYAGLPEGATVFFSDRDMAWQGPTPYRGFLYAPLMLADKTDRALDARVMPETLPAACPREQAPVQPVCAPPAPEAVWSRVRLRRDGGTVVVAPLGRVPETGVRHALAERLRVYREARGGGGTEPPRLIGSLPGGTPWASDGVAWEKVAGGDGWALYDAALAPGDRPFASSIDDSVAFVDFLAMPPPPERARLMGTRRLLP